MPKHYTEETDCDQDVIDEEHLNDPEIKNTAQRRKIAPETNLQKIFLPKNGICTKLY